MLLKKIEDLLCKTKWKREDQMIGLEDAFLCGVQTTLEQLYDYVRDGKEIDLDELHIGM